MRINEDFLDSEGVDDIVRNDEVDIEKNTDSYGWLLEAYVYVAFVYALISIAVGYLFKFIDKKYTFGT